jgi:hypothetical protein
MHRNDKNRALVVMQRNGSEWLKPLSVKRLKPEIPLACITTTFGRADQSSWQTNPHKTLI